MNNPQAFDWLKGSGKSKISSFCAWCDAMTMSTKHGQLMSCEICGQTKGVITNEDELIRRHF